jgi:hypothetical protein
MKHGRPLILPFVALLVLAACASTTTFTSTWKAPDAQPLDPKGHKVAAVFVSTDESSRRVAEDVLVRKLNERGAQGIASYTLIPTAAVGDFESVKQQLAEAGVDGVVMMRVVDQKQRVTVRNDAPFFGYPPYYWRFSGYWGYGWGAPYSPTEVMTTTVLSIESLVYSLNRDTLIWAGTSRTSDPGNVEKLVNQVADAAAKQMQKQGLLPKES